MSTDRAREYERKPNVIEETIQRNFSHHMSRGGDPDEFDELVTSWTASDDETFHLPITITEPEEAGPPTDSMGATKHPHPKSEQGGYDTLEIGLYGKWKERDGELLFSELNALKEDAQENDQYITLSGKEFNVRPRGFQSGKKNYDYVIEASGIVIGISEKVSKSHPAIRIRYGSIALIGRDAFAIHAAILELLTEAGFIYEKELVSRCDLCVDMGVKADTLILPYFHNRVVCRGRNGSNHFEGATFTSLTIGSKVQVCIYDKMKELNDKSDEIKRHLMFEHRLIHLGTLECTRVEFRIRRCKLKEMGIDTMDDLREKQNDLVRWLSEDWFRILESPKVKGHTADGPTAIEWKEVQKTFDAVFPVLNDTPVGINRDWNNKREVQCDQEDMKKQTAGCLARVVALTGNAVSLEHAKEHLRSIFNDILVLVYDKARKLAKKKSITLGVDLLQEAKSAEVPFGASLGDCCDADVAFEVYNEYKNLEYQQGEEPFWYFMEPAS